MGASITGRKRIRSVRTLFVPGDANYKQAKETMAQLGKRKVNHITYFLKQHFLIIASENKDTKTVQRIFDLSDKQRTRRVEKIFKK